MRVYFQTPEGQKGNSGLEVDEKGQEGDFALAGQKGVQLQVIRKGGFLFHPIGEWVGDYSPSQLTDCAVHTPDREFRLSVQRLIRTAGWVAVTEAMQQQLRNR